MKKVLKVGIVVVGLSLAFGIGGFTVGANLDWQTEVINDASSRMAKAGHFKKEELAQNDLGGQMKLLLEDEISAQEEELARLLEEYYQMKLAGLEGSDQYAFVESEIERLKNLQYERYKKEIDAMFRISLIK